MLTPSLRPQLDLLGPRIRSKSRHVLSTRRLSRCCKAQYPRVHIRTDTAKPNTDCRHVQSLERRPLGYSDWRYQPPAYTKNSKQSQGEQELVEVLPECFHGNIERKNEDKLGVSCQDQCRHHRSSETTLGICQRSFGGDGKGVRTPYLLTFRGDLFCVQAERRRADSQRLYLCVGATASNIGRVLVDDSFGFMLISAIYFTAAHASRYGQVKARKHQGHVSFPQLLTQPGTHTSRHVKASPQREAPSS